MPCRLVGREGRDSGPRLGQAICRHDRPARIQRPPDEDGGDGSATQRDSPKVRWRRRITRRVEDPDEQGRDEGDVAERGILGQGRDDRCGLRPVQDRRAGRPTTPPATRRRLRRHDRARRPAASPLPAAGPRATTPRSRQGRLSTGWQPSVRPVVPEVRIASAGAIGSAAATGVALPGAIDQGLEGQNPVRQGSGSFLEPGARDHDSRSEDSGRGGQLGTCQADPDGLQRPPRRRAIPWRTAIAAAEGAAEQGDSVDPARRRRSATRSRPRPPGGPAPPTSSWSTHP